MIIGRKVAASAAWAAIALLASTSSADAFTAARSPAASSVPTRLRAGGDTDVVLPSFETKEEYTAYLKAAGSLPGGFAVGTAAGKFVSVEAPSLGQLPIKATVIHLTEGPTDSWAAVFTSNKVS